MYVLSILIGLLITAQSVNGQYTGSYLRFAQRNQHHDSKQPILVVFTDDGKVRHPTYVSPDDQGTYHFMLKILFLCFLMSARNSVLW